MYMQFIALESNRHIYLTVKCGRQSGGVGRVDRASYRVPRGGARHYDARLRVAARDIS